MRTYKVKALTSDSDGGWVEIFVLVGASVAAVSARLMACADILQILNVEMI